MTATPGAAFGVTPPQAPVSAPLAAAPPEQAPREPVAPAVALRAAGEPVTLAGGAKVQLTYTFLSLYFIEEAYGSLQALLDVAARLETEGASAPMIATVMDLVRFGWPLADGQEEPPSRVWIGKHLDPTRLEEYSQAAMSAIDQAFGPAAPPEKRDPSQPFSASRPDPTQGSTGSSGGPSPSGVDSPTASGA